MSPVITTFQLGWNRFTLWVRMLVASGLMTFGKPWGLKLTPTVLGSGSASPAWTTRVAVIVQTSPTDRAPSAVLETTYGLAALSRSPSRVSITDGLTRSGVSAEEVLVTTNW